MKSPPPENEIRVDIASFLHNTDAYIHFWPDTILKDAQKMCVYPVKVG